MPCSCPRRPHRLASGCPLGAKEGFWHVVILILIRELGGRAGPADYSSQPLCVLSCLQDPDDSLIVLSGGGTSGRLAFLMAVSLACLLACLYWWKGDRRGSGREAGWHLPGPWAASQPASGAMRLVSPCPALPRWTGGPFALGGGGASRPPFSSLLAWLAPPTGLSLPGVLQQAPEGFGPAATPIHIHYCWRRQVRKGGRRGEHLL